MENEHNFSATVEFRKKNITIFELNKMFSNNYLNRFICDKISIFQTIGTFGMMKNNGKN